jgi:hypothetical protein
VTPGPDSVTVRVAAVGASPESNSGWQSARAGPDQRRQAEGPARRGRREPSDWQGFKFGVVVTVTQ